MQIKGRLEIQSGRGKSVIFGFNVEVSGGMLQLFHRTVHSPVKRGPAKYFERKIVFLPES